MGLLFFILISSQEPRPDEGLHKECKKLVSSMAQRLDEMKKQLEEVQKKLEAMRKQKEKK